MKKILFLIPLMVFTMLISCIPTPTQITKTYDYSTMFDENETPIHTDYNHTTIELKGSRVKFVFFDSSSQYFIKDIQTLEKNITRYDLLSEFDNQMYVLIIDDTTKSAMLQQYNNPRMIIYHNEDSKLFGGDENS